MSLTKLDIDRFISTLRTKSKEFNSISNVQLASMLEETISNIKEVSYFWATICSDNKGTTKTPAEGEEWLGGPFASVLATQYYIKSLINDDDLVEGNFNNSENSYKVFPNNFIERITFPFINAKVYFNKSMSFEDINKFRGFSKSCLIFPSNKINIYFGISSARTIGLPISICTYSKRSDNLSLVSFFIVFSILRFSKIFFNSLLSINKYFFIS